MEAALGCGRNFWESLSLGRVWRDVFGGGERGKVHVFEMLVCTVNKASGAQGLRAVTYGCPGCALPNKG